MTNAYIVPPSNLVVRTDNTPTLSPLSFSASQLSDKGFPFGITAVDGKVYVGSPDELPVFVRYADGRADILDKPDTESVAYSSFMVTGIALLVSEHKPKNVSDLKHTRKLDNVKRVAIGLLDDGNVFVVFCTATLEKLTAMLCAYGVANALLLASDDVYFNNPRNGIFCGEQPVITLQATYYEDFPTPVLAIDPAHGGNDPGVCSASLIEKTLTLAIAKEMQTYLREYYYGTFILTREDDRLIPLSNKVQFLSDIQADFVYVCHINALDGVTRGFECIGYSDASESAKALVQSIHAHTTGLLGTYAINDNGLHLKSLKFLEVLPCPAIIANALYIDNAEDAHLLSRPDMLRTLGAIQGESLAQGMGLERRVSTSKPISSVDEKRFKVRVGQNFKFKLGALELCEQLRQLGFDAYVTRE